MRDLHDLLIAGRLLGGSGGSPAPQPALITKNITANGTYSAADDNADGYSAVNVAVPLPDYASSGLVLSCMDANAINTLNTYKLSWYLLSTGFSIDVHMKFTDFIKTQTQTEAVIVDTRKASADRYSLRIKKLSNKYELIGNKNSTWIHSADVDSSYVVDENEPHTFTLTADGEGVVKVFCDGILWGSETVAAGVLGAIYREFTIFTSYDEATSWTFGKDYRTVDRLMLYNRALTAAEISAHRAADIRNFETEV